MLGLWLAARYNRDLAGLLSFIPQETIARVSAFVIIVLAASVAGALIAWIIRSAVHAIMLGWVDHLGGAVFGFLLGAYFLGGVLAFITRFSLLGLQPTVNHSPLAHWLVSLPFMGSLASIAPIPPVY